MKSPALEATAGDNAWPFSVELNIDPGELFCDALTCLPLAVGGRKVTMTNCYPCQESFLPFPDKASSTMNGSFLG